MGLWNAPLGEIVNANSVVSRLADWDDDDPSAVPDTSSRWDKVVVIKHMFLPEVLVKDPGEILELKDDVRNESSKFGDVTNVVIYDKEESGVVTVRFANAMAAKACAKIFDGRFYEGRRLQAYIADGSEKFKKSKKQDSNEEDEQERLEGFGQFIEAEEGS